MDPRRFYLLIDDAQLGPFTAEEVQDEVDDGRADAGTYFWEEGMADWIPLAAFEGADLVLPEPTSDEMPLPTEAPEETAYAPAVPFVAPAPAVPLAKPAALFRPGPPAGSGRALGLALRQQEARRSTGGALLLIGWLFVLCGLIFATFHRSPLFLLLLGPAALMALAFGIMACLYRRPAGGTVLIVVTIILLPGTLLTLRHFNLSPFGVPGRARLTAAQSVEFIDPSFLRADGKMEVRGKLRNITNQPITNLEVVVEWRNHVGQPVAQNVDPIEPLAPGEVGDFEIVVVDDERVAKYSPYVRFAP
ncbi:hypothetical protein BH23VER1_BH23VER1_32400 [soil metagenome]